MKNFGFRKFGHEARLYLDTSQLISRSENKGEIRIEVATKKLVSELQELRLKKIELSPGLQRSSEDFFHLLQIPKTYICTLRKQGLLRGYALYERGIDFPSCVYEWSLESDSLIYDLSLFFRENFQVNDLLWLGPKNYLKKRDLVKIFSEKTFVLEETFMSYAMIYRKEKIDKNLYIWGLDSI